MGCGCGKRKTTRVKGAATVQRPPSGGNRVATAKTYQSATMKKPTGPVTGGRKTV